MVKTMLGNFVKDRMVGIWQEAGSKTKFSPGIYLIIPRGSNSVSLATFVYDEVLQLYIFETFSSVGMLDRLQCEEYYWFRSEEIWYYSKLNFPVNT